MQKNLIPPYAELDCLSNFTFLKGASHPEQLVEHAAKLHYQALALADECSLAGVVRAHGEAKRQNLKLIIGSRFVPEQCPAEIIVLACNRNGYGNLSELITLARAGSVKGQYRLSLDDFLKPQAGWEHLENLPDCLILFKPGNPDQTETWLPQLESLLKAFKGRIWLGLGRHYQNKDIRPTTKLQTLTSRLGIPLVATGGVEMHARSLQPLHDTLAAIRLKRPIQECGYALQANAEHHMRSIRRLAALYPESALLETLEISRRCTFSLDDIKYEYPIEIVPEGHTVKTYLRQETYAGAQRRYPQGPSDAVKAQLEEELGLISELDYEPYFLTVYDIVLHARQQGILCQGRGSAANSAVCYCLGITEVNPENGNSLFARFISRTRNEPPDIDVDFEHRRREEIIQYIYRKYGRQRAALTAVVTTYRTRSVLRDTGKALGLDLDLVARVAHSFHHWDSKQALLGKIAEQGLDPGSRIAKSWAGLAQDLMGFPRHLSQHPGGFVIARSKLTRLVPIENAAMPERSVVQWDKDDLDAMHLLKIDVLALGMLSALKRALALTGWCRAQALTMQTIPGADKPTYEMMCRADTIGVFQIESRAQMSMLPRLKPEKFYDLVVQVAIVRPGPIQGGMVHPYLRRRQKIEKHDCPPGLEHILSRTLGVPIFQEQAMQIAKTGAGFSDDEADELRRSMAAWQRKGGVDKFRTKFLDGMRKHGYAEDFAERLFKQLEGFGEYGFPESHAASFAILAYISAWLKRHEPEAFLVALLNSQPMGFYSSRQLVQDARNHQVAVLPVDIATSLWEAAFEFPALPPPVGGDTVRPQVRLGFNLIRGLSKEAGLRIESARRQRAFTDTHDLALRAALSRHDMDALAGADALLSLSGHRRLAHWAAANGPFKGLLRPAPLADTHLPELPEPTEGQSTLADYRSLGLTLGRHPVDFLRPALQARHFVSAATLLKDYPDRRLARACGMVTMRQRPQTAKGIVFVSLEDETGSVNVIVRPDLAERQRTELTQAGLLGVYGIWQRHQGTCHLIASRLVDLSSLLGQLSIPSRNFH
ncbi:error-prone DNA polymerase [Paralcaligenes ginsengisoli]